jgi:hypothetical protein
MSGVIGFQADRRGDGARGQTLRGPNLDEHNALAEQCCSRLVTVEETYLFVINDKSSDREFLRYKLNK